MRCPRCTGSMLLERGDLWSGPAWLCILCGHELPVVIPLKDRIRRRREELGLSKWELAQRVGISETHLYSLEQGATRTLHRLTRRAFARVFAVDEGELCVRR